MFDKLKKKLGEAIKSFAKKEEMAVEAAAEVRQPEPIPAVQQGKAETKQPEAQKATPPPTHEAAKTGETGSVERIRGAEDERPSQHDGHEVHETKAAQETPKAARRHQESVAREAPHAHTDEIPAARSARMEEHDEGNLIKLSLSTKLKGVFSSRVALKEGEIDGFLENIRLSLLESDVSYDTTEALLETMGRRLRDARFDPKSVQAELVREVRASLLDVLASGGDGGKIREEFRERIAAGRIPVRVLFLGPNGTGKTTTIAKMAHYFKKMGATSVISASDTFRAAAIEQTEHHAAKVGVPVIKSKYGADPASIAFDAIAYAKAHGIQVVLIDTAGRQETNKNLINEMQKIVRVAQPDIVLFVGESTAGNALSEQVKEFGKFMKIDGIILTKLDCDARGGNAISIAHSTGIPLVFIGTGESYESLQPYSPEFIVDSILPGP